MPALSKPIQVETAFETYQLNEQVGEGGAGRVYGGFDSGGGPIALKVLTANSQDKRKRFKNEIGFLARNRHSNIVTVTDHGVGSAGSVKGPFYVMPRYQGCLRDELKRGLSPARAMELFSQILDGVEAAHLLGVTHRDLKPENVLIDVNGRPAVADFGVAQFAVDDLHTRVETRPGTRLANFQYAAPEQRRTGQKVGQTADIYALGLMLHELFTGSVPQGTSYGLIADVSEEYGFLDALVADMIRHNPDERPRSIEAVKAGIQKYKSVAVSRQKLNQLTKVVIPAGEITDPLAHEPPRIIGVDWRNATLFIDLNQEISEGWAQIIRFELQGFSTMLGVSPSHLAFVGAQARIGCPDSYVQATIDNFKDWAIQATQLYHMKLAAAERQAENMRQVQLENERREEEARLRVRSTVKF